MKRISLMKKLAAVLLAMTLLLGSFPVVYAEDGGEVNPSETTSDPENNEDAEAERKEQEAAYRRHAYGSGI